MDDIKKHPAARCPCCDKWISRNEEKCPGCGCTHLDHTGFPGLCERPELISESGPTYTDGFDPSHELPPIPQTSPENYMCVFTCRTKDCPCHKKQ
jgi:hypothetical protein